MHNFIKPICIVIAAISLSLVISTGLLFAQSSGTGIGVILGEPTGLSLKSWIGPDTAFDIAVAWSFEHEDEIHLHGDWLRHYRGIFNERSPYVDLPLYLGIGGRVILQEDALAGIRFVGGIDILFERIPVDIFLEIAPILDLAPSTEFNGNANVGFRYWF